MSKDSKIPDLREIPQTGLLRAKEVLKFVRVSRSSWWSGVRSGKFPQPVKLGPRTTCWRASDIRALIEG